MITKKKTRTKIPKATSDAVLKEYNHRCSICGADRPQLHHIAEDPSNHEPLNLLPLCPNCHLSDQHNPTSRIDPGILVLFRKHKDPAILSPQFEPLYRRMKWLSDGIEKKLERDYLATRVVDLCQFVQSLEMGSYFSNRIADRFHLKRQLHDWSQISKSDFAALSDAQVRIQNVYVIAHVVELVRYQSSWSANQTTLKRQ